MPVNTALALKTWSRYQFCRDNGHTDFIKKADLCEDFFRGKQWSDADEARLRGERRPALTINKIISTISNVMGEQIYNRNEISFQPLNGSPEETAEALRKVYKQIGNNNQLDWRRSDMFTDGIITSRGYLDVRLGFTDNMQGEVAVSNLNPKNVIPDPDAEEADPDTWNEVTTTKWMTADDIAVLYNEDDAELLRGRTSAFEYGYDSIEMGRDRYGHTVSPGYDFDNVNMDSVLRNIRVIERQYRVLNKQKHFVDTTNGDMRAVPEGWDRNRIALIVDHFGFKVVSKLVKRIKWCVVADNVVLHEDWSPYKHFTVVPYFPYFRRGKTIGLVENLVGSQELLNKVSSQELHVVNTTANSGWKVKTGALINMSLEELEQRGAQTGLVLELNELDGAEKITPNATPNGLDRISYKAEEHIKTISNVGDSQQGQDRADVAAKAIQAKRQASSTAHAKPMDSLQRTDFWLARNILDIVQEYITEERLISITHPGSDGENENITVNEVTPEGIIANDLTVGEYGVIISSVPQRETLEDSQFDQAVSMRKDLGIAIPDAVIIDSSRLMNKKDILKKMEAAAQSPAAIRAAETAQAQAKAELRKTTAEAAVKEADSGLRQVKAKKENIAAEKDALTPIEGQDGGSGAELIEVQAEIALEERKFEHEVALDAQKMALEREKVEAKTRLDAKVAADKAVTDRIAKAAAAKSKPQSQPGA